MILYFIIIAVAMFFICLFNGLLSSICFVENGLLNLILIVGFGVVVEFVIDLIVSLIITLLPAKIFKFFDKSYKWEKKFYEKLGVRKWKDYIPVGKGPIFLGIDKSKIDNPNDVAFLNKLVDECFKAEVMHFLSMFMGFFLILIFPINYALIISLPIAIVNMFLQLLPFIVQRYNLPKLKILQKRAKLAEERKLNKKEQPND